MPGTILFGIDVESANKHSVGFAQHAGELFRDLDVPVTWYLTGKTLEAFPDTFFPFEADESIELQAHTYDHLLLKTVLIRVPEGKVIHGSTDWFMQRGASVGEVDADLERCQQVFLDVLGRKASALTGPWGYYRGLGDRPDLLEIVHRHGLRALRTFARNEDDGQPVPLEWQPYFYEPRGFPDILECLVHDYQDDFYFEAFARPECTESYADHLKGVARKVADRDLVWSLCSHDHGCATAEGFAPKAAWYRAIVEYAQGLGIRFMSVSDFYEEMVAKRG